MKMMVELGLWEHDEKRTNGLIDPTYYICFLGSFFYFWMEKTIYFIERIIFFYKFCVNTCVVLCFHQLFITLCKTRILKCFLNCL